MAQNEKVGFIPFFLIWAARQNWKVPDIHIGICHFLESRGRLAVLEVFRGVGKSTLLAVYNAWAYYIDPTYRILHQGDQNTTAFKTSRDTRHVLINHPLTRDYITEDSVTGEVSFFWVPGHNDPRNPSMQAAGILSNITSSRADEIQNDDVEVPKNVGTPENREKLRHRLSEQIHIAVPGAKKLFIGTPHSHASIYDEQIEKGAQLLKIPLFTDEHQIDFKGGKQAYTLKFKPEIVFAGIGKYTKVLEAGKDYTWKDNKITFKADHNGVRIDCYAGNAWPERFTSEEMALRRKECNTHNEWDSQYQLHAKPVGDIRLNPERIIPYDIQPRIHAANKTIGLYLGNVRLVGAIAYWDCALGKITSDASAFSLMLTDDKGYLYWQVCEDREGDIDQQCKRIRELAVQYLIPCVEVETNGPGGHVPAILKKHLKGTGCAVRENFQTTNKNKRILDAFEAPMDSGYLWAHVDVLNGPMWDQMIEWNPEVKEQPDDYLDSGAGAIAATPVRIGKTVGNPATQERENWRPNDGLIEVQTDY